MKVCDKTCIFCFFPIINKYLCMAKRSLLSRCPSYIVYLVGMYTYCRMDLRSSECLRSLNSQYFVSLPSEVQSSGLWSMSGWFGWCAAGHVNERSRLVFGLSLRTAGFRTRPVRKGCGVDKVALGQVFITEYFGYSPSVSFYQCPVLIHLITDGI